MSLFKLISLFSLLIPLSIQVEVDSVTCPTLSCSESFDTGTCYLHSATNPVEWIKMANCTSPDEYCEIQNPAFFSMSYQETASSRNPLKSISFNHQVEGKCVPLKKKAKNLLPGRYCDENYECLSFNCTSNKCYGETTGKACSDPS